MTPKLLYQLLILHCQEENKFQSTPANGQVSVYYSKRRAKIWPTHSFSVSDSFSIVRPDKSAVFDRNDSLATRAKKLQAIKASTERSKRIHVKELKAVVEESTNHEVQFLIQVNYVTSSAPFFFLCFPPRKLEH